MSTVRGSWLFAVVALTLPLSAATAQADDANTTPPLVELRAAGQEGILGPKSPNLAFFSTATSEPGSEYAPKSKVSFACTVDARTVPCGATYSGCCSAGVPIAEPLAGSPARPLREGGQFVPGPFIGSVPMPTSLTDGPHTVTVTATDGDGTGPPASVGVTYDTTPPSAPELTKAPPHVSHIHKPTFRYRATDAVRLIGKRDEVFRAAFRRLDPPEWIFRERRESFYIGSWIPRCTTLLVCEGRSRAVYEGFQRNLFFGVPEWLQPGPYEFSVYARDAVGNESPLTRYRFRILPGRARGG